MEILAPPSRGPGREAGEGPAAGGPIGAQPWGSPCGGGRQEGGPVRGRQAREKAKTMISGILGDS